MLRDRYPASVSRRLLGVVLLLILFALEQRQHLGAPQPQLKRERRAVRRGA